jgi:hypothetical protein
LGFSFSAAFGQDEIPGAWLFHPMFQHTWLTNLAYFQLKPQVSPKWLYGYTKKSLKVTCQPTHKDPVTGVWVPNFATLAYFSA